MTQGYEKIIIINSVEVEEYEIQTPEENEVDELLGDLNPRYFEEIERLDNAKERIANSDICVSSKFNFFNNF